MKWKKIVLTTVCSTLGLSLAAACSNSSNSSGSLPAQENKQEVKKAAGPVKLKFWGGIPGEDGPQEVVDKWNAQNPDIQVEYVRFVNDDAGNLKLDTALMTGQDGDLYINYNVPRMLKRIQTGIALDLAKFNYNIEENMGKVVEGWKIDGKYYSLPTTRRLYNVWLNKDALDEAKLPVPTDWTIEDVKEYAKKLQKGPRWGFIQTPVTLLNSIDGSIVGKGFVKPDGTSNFDEPNMKTGLKLLSDMMHEDKTTPPLGQQLSTKMPVETMFLKGDAAMLNGGEWVFRLSNNLKDNPRSFKIALAPLPKMSAGQKDFLNNGGLGEGISINPQSKNQQEAWKFLKWYAEGGMMPLVKVGRIPAYQKTKEDDVLKLLVQGAESTYDMESLKRVVFSKEPTFQLLLDQKVLDLRREEYERYFLKDKSLDETISMMVKRHNDYIQQTKK
jgi:multiple sugar transport system substrate-binding protein